jgi:hypothetical protein
MSRTIRLIGKRACAPGVPVGLHLAPRPAHNVLAHRAAKHRRQRAPDATGVDAGEIGARDQRLGRARAALIGAQTSLFHSLVPPSGSISRARGTAISVRPNVPVSIRVRLPKAHLTKAPDVLDIVDAKIGSFES